ncbi:hypothetical protein SELMODRAFT_78600 [Selaginella moellendorffii]|uniref:Uncharacterized protein CYP797B5 n=1 Tax=Selaginella moellendorffii TaxID=88036 RepID=D8QU64_SELML|nr:cytochrome P450 CYP736A12 [Selaginella moellendorffii]EFJ35810.1 hypothetical protein SELMODRAFT_78600 [Selaginella moellendorffii]|eukprot:XP_002962347.1 cytochrome P450 CYP736A12 [Selaginella moellendorffii]
MDLALAVSFAISIALWGLWLLKARSNLPPSPWGLPLIGHLHLLAGMPPHKALQRMANKYGPIISLRLGMIPTVVISSPELAKEVFTTHDLNFASRPYMVFGEYFSYSSVGLVSSPHGKLWRNTRKLCTTELFTAQRIDSFSWVRREELSRALEGILKAHGNDKPVEVRKVASVFAFNITSRIVMSKRYFGDENVDADAMEFKELNDNVLELTINPCLSNLVPWYLRWLDWQIPRYKRIHAKQDKFLQKIVDEHKETTRKCKDFLDIMLDFFGAGTQGETYVKANLMEMLIGGTDTTSTASEWLMAVLMHDPRVMAKLREELDRVVRNTRMVQESDLPKLEYLQLVLKETLRRYPPGAIIMPHISSQASNVGGFHVPKGTTLLVNSWAIGMDPAVWENPTQFHPERFLGSSIDVKGQNFELLPFGSGRRKCPGMAMGLRAVELLVANLIHGFDWSFVPGTTPSMEDVFRSAIQLKTPLQAMASPRFPKDVYINQTSHL